MSFTLDFDIDMMAVFSFLLLTGIVIFVVRKLLRRFKGSASEKVAVTVRLDRISSVVSVLAREPENGMFVTLYVPDTAGTAGEPAAVQFSVEDLCVGFDWLLYAKSNIKDRPRFEECAGEQGVRPAEKEKEGMKYLRVEMESPEDLAAFAATTLQTLYHLQPGSELELFTNVPEWKRKGVIERS